MRHNKYRFLYMIVTGFFLTFLMKVTVYTVPQNHPLVFDFLITILITCIVWEGNLRMDAWLNQKYPWVSKTKQRFILQLVATLLFSAVTIYAMMLGFNFLVHCESVKNQFLMVGSFGIGLTVSFLLLTFEISSQFFMGWKQSLVEVEKYKAENAQAQLQNLKDQINPHFLFNNLSVLSSLVYKNQDKAVDFINQLSKVYRYLLDSKTNELVTLREELHFLDSYFYLLKIRFDEGLHFQIEIADAHMNLQIPPMTLQMLVENAIKHNEVSSAFPLTISLRSSGNALVVANNLQKRMPTEASSKTGLKNITDRYRFLSDREVLVVENENSFEITIPLIDPV
ncbi:MAG: histidine kinase [Bacteroidetes bacterium]|nr:histidine kinase [Bacteroidota bacterium]